MNSPRRPVLVLSYWNLNQAAFGGARRIEALLRLLGDRVVLCQPAPAHPVLDGAAFTPDLGRRKRGINWGMFNFFLPGPAALARRLLRERKPALVVATSIWAFAPFRGLDDSIPVVLDAHDVNAAVLGQRFGPRHPFTRLVEAWERRVARRVRHIFACSEIDRDLFLTRYNLPPDRVSVVPNGTEIGGAAPGPIDPAVEARLEGARTVLLFMGKLDYQPNAEALRFLADTVMPALERARPGDFRLLVVGGPVPAGRFPDSFVFTGRVPEVPPYLARADLCLAPLFSGGGTRLKILEYMGAAKPVVATPKAAEGLDAVSGRDCALAEPGDFAAAVLRLADDPAAAASLGQGGLARVRESFSWDASRARWARVLGAYLDGDLL